MGKKLGQPDVCPRCGKPVVESGPAEDWDYAYCCSEYPNTCVYRVCPEAQALFEELYKQYDDYNIADETPTAAQLDFLGFAFRESDKADKLWKALLDRVNEDCTS